MICRWWLSIMSRRWGRLSCVCRRCRAHNGMEYNIKITVILYYITIYNE
jgi:hypothetical protein